jgi:hypothetical protein
MNINDCELTDKQTGKCLFKGAFPDCWNHPAHSPPEVICLSHEAAKKYRAELKEKRQFKRAIEKEITRVTAKPSRKRTK